MNLLQAVARSVARPFVEARDYPWDGGQAWNSLFSLDGSPMLRTTMQPDREKDITGEFLSLASGAYMGNGVAFACMMTRYLLFSEVTFQYQQYRKGLPGPLFGTPALAILDHPEPKKTTGDLMARALLDADIDGNWFGVRRPGRIKRLRPDWTTIIVGSPNSDMGAWDPDAEFIGLAYEPGGPGRNPPMFFLADEVAHFAPYPDPVFAYRGMSWLVPIIREVMGDSTATSHKLAFFRNAATPNIAITLPATMSVEKAREWVALFDQEHKGVINAYKSMYFGGGAEATTIGSSFKDMDYRALQGAFETRIAAASGMHPVIVPFSEGLTGSSLNAGNFQQAARMVADKTLRPLWRNMASSLESIVPPPHSDTKLWYNDDQVAFLRTDVKDAAEIQQTYATTINALVINGFTPESAIDATVSGDMSRLIPTGLLSVQLQAPGTILQPRSEFWPTERWLSGFGSVTPDMHFRPDHPIAVAYPSMFERVAPYEILTGEIRCDGCGKLLAEAAPGGYRGTCPRCRTAVARDAPPRDIRVIEYKTENRAAWLLPVRDVTPPPAPIIVEPHTHFDADSFRVSVEPARIEEGAIKVDVHAPEPAQMTIAEGAIRVDVAAARAPQVRIEEGAVKADVHVTIPERSVTVAPAEVNVTTPEPVVRFEEGAIRVDSPEVNVTTPDVHIDAPVTVTIPEPKPIRRTVERDANDRIIAVTEER